WQGAGVRELRGEEIAPSSAGQVPIGGKSTLSSEETQVLAPAFECTTHTAPNDVSPPRFGISPPELSNGLKRARQRLHRRLHSLRQTRLSAHCESSLEADIGRASRACRCDAFNPIRTSGAAFCCDARH